MRDEPPALRGALDEAAAAGAEALVVNGGTGIAGRDRTYEAVAGVIEKRLDGFGELFRMLSFAEIGSAAMLSRAVAGTWGGRVVFSVPGSLAAVGWPGRGSSLPRSATCSGSCGRTPRRSPHP